MPNTLEIEQRPTADEIAEMVDRGEDVSRYFSGKGVFLRPGPNGRLKTEITITHTMVHKLQRYAHAVDMDVQSAIEDLLNRALDQHSRSAEIGKGVQQSQPVASELSSSR